MSNEWQVTSDEVPEGATRKRHDHLVQFDHPAGVCGCFTRTPLLEGHPQAPGGYCDDGRYRGAYGCHPAAITIGGSRSH